MKKIIQISSFLILGIVLVVVVMGSSKVSDQKIASFADCANAGYPVAVSSPPTCRANHKTFVGPVSNPEAQNPPQSSTNVVFEQLVTSDSRGKYPNAQEIILTQSEWASYWTKVHNWLPSIPPLIPVDFSKQVVVAVSEGPKDTTGYDLRITGIQSFATETIVNVHESIPSISCKVSMSLTNNYNIVAFARPTTHTRFVVTSTKRDC